MKRATLAKVFVPDPAMHGRYIKTDGSVLLLACPHCKAALGEPCRGARGEHTGMTHTIRRLEAKAQKREARAVSQRKRDTVDMKTTTEIRSRHVRCEGCDGNRFLVTLRRGARPLVRCADCEREVK